VPSNAPLPEFDQDEPVDILWRKRVRLIRSAPDSTTAKRNAMAARVSVVQYTTDTATDESEAAPELNTDTLRV